MNHSATIALERGEDEVSAELEIEWTYSRGEYLEPGHSCNGYGRGWSCSRITATVDGKPVQLTEEEEQRFMDTYHPSNLPDPRDHGCDDRDDCAAGELSAAA